MRLLLYTKLKHCGILLNFCIVGMTVRGSKANSHAKQGWEQYTDATIRALALGRSGIIFLLWGNSAQEKTK